MALPHDSVAPPGQTTVGVHGPANSMEALQHALEPAAARGAQMLGIGGRFHSEYSGILLGGDVMPYVLRHAECPVDICADQRIPRPAPRLARKS